MRPRQTARTVDPRCRAVCAGSDPPATPPSPRPELALRATRAGGESPGRALRGRRPRLPIPPEPAAQGRNTQGERPRRESRPGPKEPGRNNQAQKTGKMLPRRQGIPLLRTEKISATVIMTSQKAHERRKCHDHQPKLRHPYPQRRDGARLARIRRPRAHGPPAPDVRRGRARRRGARRGRCPRRGPRCGRGTRRGAHQLRGHAQQLRLPGRDEHRRTQWHDPEVGPRPGLQRAGLVLQRAVERRDRGQRKGRCSAAFTFPATSGSTPPT